jgi:hypothetical protein
MRKVTLLATALMLSGLLTTAALADAGQGDGKAILPDQAQSAEKGKANVTKGKETAGSEALQAQKDYLKKREEMKARRDAGMEMRRQNIQSNNPGNTGM